MFELSVEKSFSAAHWLRDYEGKCARLHGHNYRVVLSVAGETLDQRGMLIDFADMKKALASVLEPLDHASLNEVAPFDRLNPTAENIAWHIATEAARILGDAARVSQVSVWETDTCVAVYRP